MQARDRLLGSLFVLGLIVFAGGAVSDPTWKLEPSDIVDYYDGDTFYIDLDGLPPVFGERLPVRLLNVDTPELRSRCKDPDVKVEEKRRAQLATDALIRWVSEANSVVVKNIERGSFFRVAADVHLDGVWLNERLVNEGYAVAVFDGKSADWCEIIRIEWNNQ